MTHKVFDDQQWYKVEARSHESINEEQKHPNYPKNALYNQKSNKISNDTLLREGNISNDVISPKGNKRINYRPYSKYLLHQKNNIALQTQKIQRCNRYKSNNPLGHYLPLYSMSSWVF